MTVTYTITSSAGEQTYTDVEASKALKDITQVVEEKSKWLFVDGTHKDPKALTADELSNGSVIILTDTLMGG